MQPTACHRCDVSLSYQWFSTFCVLCPLLENLNTSDIMLSNNIFCRYFIWRGYSHSRRQSSRLRGAKRLSEGGPKFEIKHKSRCLTCLQKRKLVNWGGGRLGGPGPPCRRPWLQPSARLKWLVTINKFRARGPRVHVPWLPWGSIVPD